MVAAYRITGGSTNRRHGCGLTGSFATRRTASRVCAASTLLGWKPATTGQATTFPYRKTKKHLRPVLKDRYRRETAIMKRPVQPG